MLDFPAEEHEQDVMQVHFLAITADAWDDIRNPINTVYRRVHHSRFYTAAARP